MIYFGQDTGLMLNHTADVMGDRVCEENGYEPEEEAVPRDLGALSDTMKSHGGALALTGEPLDSAAVRALFKRVVTAELANWVPGSSQRLIFRAGAALEIPAPAPRDVPECHPDRHVLANTWVGDVWLLHCAACGAMKPYQSF